MFKIKLNSALSFVIFLLILLTNFPFLPGTWYRTSYCYLTRRHLYYCFLVTFLFDGIIFVLRMSADIDLEAGVTSLTDSSPCTLLSAEDLSRDAADDEKTTDILLELKELREIPHADCDENKDEEPQETDVLLDPNGACALKEDNVGEIKEKEVVNQVCQELKKKRGSTIDVVNCDETIESSESGSLAGGTAECLTNLKDDDAEEATVEGEEDNELFDFREMAAGAMRHAEELVRRMLLHVSWTICHFHALPKWLQDNDFIWQGYRPPLPSFWDCIKSIFSIHTETGNIWTHMLGNYRLNNNKNILL